MWPKTSYTSRFVIVIVIALRMLGFLLYLMMIIIVVLLRLLDESFSSMAFFYLILTVLESILECLLNLGFLLTCHRILSFDLFLASFLCLSKCLMTSTSCLSWSLKERL